MDRAHWLSWRDRCESAIFLRINFLTATICLLTTSGRRPWPYHRASICRRRRNGGASQLRACPGDRRLRGLFGVQMKPVEIAVTAAKQAGYDANELVRIGTEARLMFDILHYTHLRLGDASRFGSAHLQQTLKIMMVKVATEKSKGHTTATVLVHRDFAVSLAAARNAGILGTGEVFTGKLVKSEILPEGVGGKVQEVRAAGRGQRAQEELPWRAQGARRGRGLFGVHGSTDDGDVRLARSQDAGALHRQSEPGQACDQRDGEDRGL